jgi:hypothetical protein
MLHRRRINQRGTEIELELLAAERLPPASSGLSTSMIIPVTTIGDMQGTGDLVSFHQLSELFSV